MLPLHPQSQEFLASVAAENRPAWSDLPLSVARTMFLEFGKQRADGHGPDLLSVVDREIADGLRVRIYRPTFESGLIPIVYFHGGGWVLGDLNSHDVVCRMLAAESKSVVISVDYRLAPESPFPAAVDDCYRAVRYVAENAVELNVDATRQTVAGDSAGGNLAAAVSIRARDENGPSIWRQVLIYPVIAPNFHSDSYNAFAEGYGLTRDTMKFFWKAYVGQDLSNVPPLADLSQVDLTGLPPALVLLATHDVLYDEGLAFANRLAEHGVLVTRMDYKGMLHGFVHFARLFDEGRRAIADIAGALRDEH